MSWGVMEGDLGWRKGPWTVEEDRLLIQYVKLHGEGKWNSVARLAGLKRNGKSCRLRWVNYLRPDLKRGQITPHEESVILELHAMWGNRWSTIARSLPGRTDNEIKNYWRTHFKKKTKVSTDNSEKAKARLIKRQQFQQQQKFHNLIEFDKFKHSIDGRDGCEHQTLSVPYESITEASEEQDLYSLLIENAYEGSNDDLLWDSLWNLDDVHGNFNETSKSSLHKFVAPFC